MSKNKFFKKLLIGGLCALTATAMIGATACKDKGDDKKPDNGDEKPPITQTVQYTVTFDLDGGTWNKENTIKVNKGDKLPADLKPTKEGKLFLYWLNGTTPVYPGITEITEDMNLVAAWKDPDPVEVEKTKDWYPESVGGEVGEAGTASTTTFEAGAAVADTDYFTINTTYAAKYDIGAKSNAPLHQFKLSLDNHTVDQAIRQDDEKAVAVKGIEKSLYTVTAKETCVITLYLNFVNMSHNSGDAAGAQILYGLNGNDGKVALYTASVNYSGNSYVTLSVAVAKDATLTVGVNNTSKKDGVLWLYGAKAEAVAESSVAVNYYDGETLLATQNVASGATLKAPGVAVFEAKKELGGWYTAAEDGEEYTFGALASDVTNVNIYAVLTAIANDRYTGTLDTNKSAFKLYIDGTDDPITDGIASTKVDNNPVWTNVSADISGKLDVTDENEQAIKLGTVKFSTITADKNTTDARLRMPKTATITFELEANYTYTITISAGGTGDTSKISLALGDASDNTSGKNYKDFEWKNLAAGTHTVTIGGGNANIQSITITATPVQA